MYILIVARSYPQKCNPLLGLFEFDQAKALMGRGHKVVYLALDLRSIFRRRRLGIYSTKSLGLDIFNISLPIGRLPIFFRYYIGKILLKICFRFVLQKFGKPDIIHAHFMGNGFMASIIKDSYKIPLVITEHSSLLRKNVRNNKLRQLVYKAYSKADKLICVSESLRHDIFSNLNINSIVVPNVVDTNEFSLSEIKCTDNFTFLSVGTLSRGKGFDILIDSFYKAFFGKNVFLKIVGCGEEYQRLQCRINDLYLNEQIELLGFLDRKKIAELMTTSHAFVLASRSETFGVVYIEAMLSGLPVIATSCGGPEDFVTPENGILIPVEDQVALTDALIELKMRISDFNRKNISENCRRKFSPHTISTELTSVYFNIIG